ncbi:T-cell surface glycoprotein CD3 delta chain [Alligator mississippiensis]|uniref:T-cell surface glycoprotein CD3 delta chain n=1 Tax=Alligator mississippiensis TaxID=8496 RepID=A0A151PG39_ALLMI|nr:T-cell surface glycoprotein CD3 delta chain [Alligator mississippiensis]
MGPWRPPAVGCPPRKRGRVVRPCLRPALAASCLCAASKIRFFFPPGALVKEANAQTISVDMRNTHLVLKCPEFSTWKKDSVELPVNASELDLGPSVNDPRGVYTCSKGNNQHTMKVHVRMCQNCIELDAATISGIVVADIVATIFLAIAVYCITGQERGHLSRASDRQNLIANEQLYQPLGERDDGHYSRLGVTRTRK